jgi:hypothetical protein
MDLTRAVQYLQQAHKDLFDPQPEFSHISTPSMIYSPGREPRYLSIYPDDHHKWTFPFLLVFLNELTEEWIRLGRCQQNIRAGQRKRKTIKWYNATEEAVIKMTFSETW